MDLFQFRLSFHLAGLLSGWASPPDSKVLPAIWHNYSWALTLNSTEYVYSENARFMQKDNPEMTANDVIKFVKLINNNGIDVCIDGGWGVDALLGEQIRIHTDLDIAVQHKDVAQIRVLLEARGYKDVPRDDTRDCNFVLGDEEGHLIDIHSYTFDSVGNIVFGVEYPYDSLNGTGSIKGFQVKCITPEWMVRFHTGYNLDDNDYHDVKLLCQRFGIKMPSEYAELELRENKLLPGKSTE
jgi:lincosamide nucleotidyltransferase A/C/D/E